MARPAQALTFPDIRMRDFPNYAEYSVPPEPYEPNTTALRGDDVYGWYRDAVNEANARVSNTRRSEARLLAGVRPFQMLGLRPSRYGEMPSGYGGYEIYQSAPTGGVRGGALTGGVMMTKAGEDYIQKLLNERQKQYASMTQSQPREYPTSDTDPQVGDSALNTVYPYLDALLDDLRTGNIKSVNSFNMWWSQMLTTLPILGANYAGKIKEIATTLRETATGFFRTIGQVRPDIGDVTNPRNRGRRFSVGALPRRPTAEMLQRVPKDTQTLNALNQKIEKAVNVMLIYIGEDPNRNDLAVRVDPENARRMMEEDILARRQREYGEEGLDPTVFETYRVFGMLNPRATTDNIDRSAISFRTGNVLQPLGEPRLPSNRPIDAPPEQRERLVQEINRRQGVAVSEAFKRRARAEIQRELLENVGDAVDDAGEVQQEAPANANAGMVGAEAEVDPFAVVRPVVMRPPPADNVDPFAGLDLAGRGRGRRRGMTHMDLLRQRLR